MSDTDQQAITTPAEYAEALFQLHEMHLREFEKRRLQRKLRDVAFMKIIELDRIQRRLNKCK